MWLLHIFTISRKLIMPDSNLTDTIRSFIVTEFLPGEDPENLHNDTPLITSGILDSLSTMKLVAFLEERFSIKIGPYETDPEFIGTIESIERLVSGKLAG
jgi:acyl carrier protein